MHRPSAEEFLLTLLESLKELPPEFAQRLTEVLQSDDGDRSQAIRRLFEDVVSD